MYLQPDFAWVQSAAKTLNLAIKKLKLTLCSVIGLTVKQYGWQVGTLLEESVIWRLYLFE